MATAYNVHHEIQRALRADRTHIADPGANETISNRNDNQDAIVTVKSAGTNPLDSATHYPLGQRIWVFSQAAATVEGELLADGDWVVFHVVLNSSGVKTWAVLTSSNIVNQATVIPDAQQEEIAAGNPGAISVDTYLTIIGADAGGDAFTLADGKYTGQLKKIIMDDATGTGTVTITSPADENTITYDAVGEAAVLRWNGTGWRIIQAYNEATTAAGPGLSTV